MEEIMRLEHTAISLLLSVVGQLVGVIGSYLFLIDPARAPDHPALLPIILMVGGGMAYVYSARLKRRIED